MRANSPIAMMEGLPLFKGLTPADLKQIAEHMERRSFRKGNSLLMRGEGSRNVLLVESGLVRICDRRCPESEVLIAFLGAGELLGEIHALDGEGHSADVIAALDTICWSMEKNDFLHCLQKYPELTYNLLCLTTKRLRHTSERIALLSTQDTMGRLARQLEIIASQCGISTPEGTIEIPLPITQSDLAALIGVSRQSINGAMHTFREQKAITYKDSQITILRPDLLARRCR